MSDGEDMFDLGPSAEEDESDSAEKSRSSSGQDTKIGSEEAEEPKVEDVDPASVPAFQYSADLNQTIYVRESVWSRFTNVTLSQVCAAGFEEGTEDISKREVHDAAIQLANENEDRLAELIREAREAENGEDGE